MGILIKHHRQLGGCAQELEYLRGPIYGAGSGESPRQLHRGLEVEILAKSWFMGNETNFSNS